MTFNRPILHRGARGAASPALKLALSALLLAGCFSDSEVLDPASLTTSTSAGPPVVSATIGSGAQSATSSTGQGGGGSGAGAGGQGGTTSSTGTSGGGGGAPQGPLAVSLAINLVPGNVVIATVDIVSNPGATVSIDYGDTTAYGTTTPELGIPASGKASTVLLGLAAGADNHVRARLSGSKGQTLTTEDIVFQTLPLSHRHFPKFTLTPKHPMPDGYMLTRVRSKHGKAFALTMMDRSARVMWYRDLPDVHTAQAANRLPNGNFEYYVPPGEFDEIDLAGNLVRKWTAPTSIAPLGLDQHEFQYIPSRDHAYVLANEQHVEDTTPIGGKPGTTVLYGKVLELDGKGGATEVWSTYPEIDVTEFVKYPDLPRVIGGGFDLTHLNSVEQTPDGKLIVSCRNLDSIFKIDPSNGEILWRLGGKKSTFALNGDPLGGFSGQHDVRLDQQGNLRVFDNGNLHVPKESRAVVYSIDETALTATFVTDYHHDPPLYSDIEGSSRVLPNGDLLVSWFQESVISEFDANKDVVWEYDARGEGPYRTEFLPTLYP